MQPEGLADVLKGDKAASLFFSKNHSSACRNSCFPLGVPCKDVLLEIFDGTFQHRQHEPFFALADGLLVHGLGETAFVRGVYRNPPVSYQAVVVGGFSQHQLDSVSVTFARRLVVK